MTWELLGTVSAWASQCFSTLPHGGKGTPCALGFDQLQSLFRAFEESRRLDDASAWFDGEVPLAVRRRVDAPPSSEVDLTSPFVERAVVHTGDALVIFGDLHGSIHSLLRCLLRLKTIGILSDSWVILRNTKLLFLGDIVDRGEYGVEVWATIMCLSAVNPSVMLVRGNHEERGTWKEYSFSAEVMRKFPREEHLVKKMFVVFCERLPHAIFLANEPCAAVPTEAPTRDTEEPTVQSFARESLTCALPEEYHCGKGASKGKSVPPPPPPSGQARPSTWRLRKEELAAKQRIMSRVAALHPLEDEWVQCSHGGIEPRFDPRPFLRSAARFAVTGCGHPVDEGRTYEGFNWSDWTGAPHASDERFSSRDPRGGKSGFCCDVADTHFFSKHTGIKAFFRGHQDTICCFKLVKLGVAEVVPWEMLLADTSLRTLLVEGVALSRFLDADDTVPVFTFSCCAEARALRDEGFGEVIVGERLADWVVKAHITGVDFIDAEVQWVTQSTCEETGEARFSWNSSRG